MSTSSPPDPSPLPPTEEGTAPADLPGGASDGYWWHHLLERSFDVVALIDARLTFLYVSPAVTRILGFAPDDLLGTAASEYLHPDDTASVLSAFEDLLASAGAVATVTCRVRTCAGAWRWVENRASNLLTHPEVRAIVVNWRDVTERRDAEDSLRRSEERTASLLQATTQAVLVADRGTGVVLEANRSAERLFLQGTGALVGLPLDRLHAPDPAGSMWDDLRLGDADARATFTSTIVTGNGTRLPVRVTCNALALADGREVLQAIYDEVGEGADLGWLLREQRDLAAALSRTSQEFHVVALCLEAVRRVPGVDIAGLYLLEEGSGDLVLAGVNGASEAFKDAVARMPASAPQVQWVREADGRDDDRPVSVPQEELEQPLMRREGISALVVVALKHRGRVFGCLNVASRTLPAVPPPVLSAIEAITALTGEALTRARAEQRTETLLQEHEERYQAILRGAMDGFFVADRAGRFLEVSARLADLLGYTTDTLLRVGLESVQARDGAEGLQRHLAALDQQGAARFETVLRTAAGAAVDVEVSAWRLPDRGLIMAFVRDLSARRRAEADLRRSEEQLRQAQKMEAIGRLAGGVAHDFNNLLTIINAGAEMVLSRLNPGDPLGTDLQEIKDAGKRAAALTRQLLTFSRRQIVQPRVVELNGIVSELERMLRRLIGEDVEMDVRLSAQPCRVVVDPGQIEQVLVNLAVNARDAMPNGGRLRIAVDQVTVAPGQDERSPVPPGTFARITVQDTGCGMDAETRERIFEPFFTTKGHQGTGLGLPTVYGIVTQGQGHITVWSAPGKGAAFEIYWPVSPATEGTTQAATAPASWSRGGETILLVEDEPSVRNIVRQILQVSGYVVLSAPGGAEALEICASPTTAIDLVITDLVMPGMTGREFVTRAREMRPGLKAIYASGYSDEVLSRHGVLEPGVQFLAKPFDVSVLREAVRRVLDDTGSQRHP